MAITLRDSKFTDQFIKSPEPIPELARKKDDVLDYVDEQHVEVKALIADLNNKISILMAPKPEPIPVDIESTITRDEAGKMTAININNKIAIINRNENGLMTGITIKDSHKTLLT